MTGRPYARRLSELEERFRGLEAAIPESPQKEAISVLHAMMQEAWRAPGSAGSTSGAEGRPAQPSPVPISELYRLAPKMPGRALNPGLAVGTPAPDFTLRDPNDELVSLHEFRGSPVVLVFYPLDWSPTCSDQLSLYQAELGQFERFGARLLAISVDSIYSHGAWAAVRGLTFPLLADFEPKGEVARRYGVYRDGDGFSERALYVVDAEGIIRYAHVSEELDRIPDIYELYRALETITGVPAPRSSQEEVPQAGRQEAAMTAGARP